MSVQFVNISESEFFSKKLLFKYMPLESALTMMKEKYLWLCNPVIWKDPFEKRFIEAKYFDGKNEAEFPLKGRVFCTCFTQTTTSEAHWANYSNGKLGVSFRLRRTALLDILNKHYDEFDIYIGKVNYLKTASIKKKLHEIDIIKEISPLKITSRNIQIQLLLLKRVAFSYEDEIRVLAIKKQKTKEIGIKLSLKTTQPFDLIERITLDPGTEMHTELMLKKLFKKEYGFKKVYKSQLYSMANEVIISI